MPDSSHPIWKLLRLAAVGVIMFVLCSTLYKNGFDKQDIKLILLSLIGLAGYDQIKTQITQQEK